MAPLHNRRVAAEGGSHRLTTGQRLVAFLRCASCRFAALYFIPFFAGLVQMGRGTAAYALFGAVFWLLTSLAIEVTNRVADRVEDEVNRPERTALCAAVGWPTLVRVQRGLWAAVVATCGGWLAVDGNPALAALLGLALAAGVGYSSGPRLARSRWVAFIVVSAVFGGAFLIGWAAGGPPGRLGWRQLPVDVGFVATIAAFTSTFAGIKDLTDREGDARVGYRSIFVALVDRGSAPALMLIALVPFAPIAALALTGVLPSRLLALVGWAPCSVMLALAVHRGRTDRDRMAHRELFYLYWLAFSSAAVLLFVPSPTLAVAVGGAWLYWTAATHWLHWTHGLRREDLRATARSVLAGLHGEARRPESVGAR